MTISPQQLLETLSWRYATKKFDPAKPISPAEWATLETSLVLTPSSFGLQPWKFLVVENPGVRAELRAASWNQPQVTDASHFVVLTARTTLSTEDITEWISCLAATQGIPTENLAPYQNIVEGFIQPLSADARHAWNNRQTYIALGQLMTSAALLGIDTCPMEGIDPAAYDRILGLENSGYATTVACAIGHRATDDKYATQPKARYSADRVISHLR